jgi:hypothetical protein
VLGRVAPNSLFGVRRSLERRLPWAPVGRARLAALERLEHPQYFPSSGPSTGRSRRATESFSPGQRGRLPVEESSQSDPEPRAPRRAPCDSLPASGIGDCEESGSLISRARKQGSERSSSTKSVGHIKIAADPVVGVGGPHSPVPAIAKLSSGEDPRGCGHGLPDAPRRPGKACFGESTVGFGAGIVKNRRQRAKGRAPKKKPGATAPGIAPPGLEPQATGGEPRLS